MSKITYAEVKRKKKPVTETLYVALDSDLAQGFNELSFKYQEAKDAHERNPGNAKFEVSFNEIKEEFDAELEKSKEYVMPFVFRGVGRERFERLMEAAPPTPKQKKEALQRNDEEAPQWDPDVFCPSLIAACLISPEFTEEEVYEMWSDDEWNTAELMSMFLVCMRVNQTKADLNLGKEFGLTPG